jgi:hypothetical protein
MRRLAATLFGPQRKFVSRLLGSRRRDPAVDRNLDAPPNHRDGVVHLACEDPEADNEHVDGKTTEQRVL